MPRPKKSAGELTTDEAMQKLFPKKARDKAKKTAQESQKKPSKDQSK
jgi:hypothetical protein